MVHEKHDMRVGVSLYKGSDEELDHIVTSGLSERGKQDFLQNAISIKCHMNDVIVAANDGGKVFGIIKKGFANGLSIKGFMLMAKIPKLKFTEKRTKFIF